MTLLRTSMTLLRTSVSAFALCAALAACGGSNDTPPLAVGDGLTPLQREDRDASASVTGLFAFATSMLATMTSDSAEPRAVDGISPPVSETTEPAPL
jgi:hypothetical protein